MREPSTLCQVLDRGAETGANPRLLNFKGADRRWHSIGLEEMAARVRAISLGLRSLGIGPGDRVVLMSENRPEWSMTDLALLSIGAVVVPIYITQPAPQIEFIISNSEPKFAVISNRALYDRALPAIEKFNLSRKIITFQTVPPIPHALLLDEVEASGKKIGEQNSSLYDAMREKVKPDDLASIVYTSDQSGTPKGVMLTHGNFVSNLLASASFFSITPERDAALSYLPLSHVFERMIVYHYLYQGISIYFAESVERVAENLVQVKPTVLTTVPRLLEKVEERILSQARKFPFLGKLVFGWCMKIARSFDPEKKPTLLYKLGHKLADLILYGRLRKRFGGRLKCVISGGARLRPDLGRLFTAAGIPVYQGYGLTETSPVISSNHPGKNRIGSVGQILPGVTAKIAEDGEIWVKGPNVMQGYYKNEEATRRVMEDGWFKTGDIGHLDSDGYLYITDRKKDLMKTSGGKYVVPQVIENLLEKSPLVEKAVAVADGKKFVSALLFAAAGELKNLAQQKNLQDLGCEELVQHPAIRGAYESVVSEANKSLSHWETIRKFAVVCNHSADLPAKNLPPRELRKELVQRYRNLVEMFYAHAGGETEAPPLE